MLFRSKEDKDLVNPNFAQLAEAAGISGTRVEKPEVLRPQLEHAFAHSGPAIVEVVAALSKQLSCLA